MQKKQITREGDLFAICLGDNLYGYGQIIAKGSTSDTIIAYEYFTPSIDPNIASITNKPVIYLYPTIDYEITEGRWKIIGNARIPHGIMVPIYKEGLPPDVRVVSHLGKVIRKATQAEDEYLGFEVSYDPRMLEAAMKAKLGHATWKPWMDEIVYKPKQWWVPITSFAAESKLPISNKQPEHAVVVHFNFGSLDLSPIFKLEKELKKAISKARVGDYDGNEIATDGSDGFLYMYGPDANKLFKVVDPILRKAKFMKGARVTLRYGSIKDNAPEKQVVLD